MLKIGKAVDAVIHEIAPGVKVAFSAITSTVVRTARKAMRDALADEAEDVISAGGALSREILRRTIVDFVEGVFDHEDKPLAATPENIEAFLDDPDAFDAADAAFVMPWLKRKRDLNGSAVSPVGTGAAATEAADTASSPATAATPSAETSAAPSAPTHSKPSKPKKPKMSGAS